MNPARPLPPAAATLLDPIHMLAALDPLLALAAVHPSAAVVAASTLMDFFNPATSPGAALISLWLQHGRAPAGSSEQAGKESPPPQREQPGPAAPEDEPAPARSGPAGEWLLPVLLALLLQRPAAGGIWPRLWFWPSLLPMPHPFIPPHLLWPPSAVVPLSPVASPVGGWDLQATWALPLASWQGV